MDEKDGIKKILSYDRKYRPTMFNSEYMGEDVKEKLLPRLKNPATYPHTILFYGVRGTGKTTAARIVGKTVQCLNPNEDGTPCNECQMCKEIDNNLILSETGSQEVYGIQEVDIAADGNKANIDEIIERALETPIYPAKYNVVIMDECHRAKADVQNRLLKIAEEPPAHLILIFCTTDKDAMIEPLLARCSPQIRVRKASPEALIDRLLYGCKKEGITTSKEALKVIVDFCDCNPRESWKKLEEIATTNEYRVTIDTVSKYLGIMDTELYIRYMEAANKGLEHIIRLTDEIKDKGIEPPDFFNNLTKFVLDCINIRLGLKLDKYPKEFIGQVGRLFKEYNASEIDMLLQVIEYANKTLYECAKSRELGELLINNTGMRIGKIKLLSIGLQNEADKALLESQMGNKEHQKGIEQAKSDRNDHILNKKSVIDSTMMQEVFGTKIKEVKAIDSLNKANVVLDDSEDSEESVSGLSDQELLNFFSAE